MDDNNKRANRTIDMHIHNEDQLSIVLIYISNKLSNIFQKILTRNGFKRKQYLKEKDILIWIIP